MEYKYYFNAVLCDRFCCNFIRGCDLGIDAYGESIVISFKTDKEPTKENIAKIEKILNSTKDEKSLKSYYANVKFDRAEVVVKE